MTIEELNGLAKALTSQAKTSGYEHIHLISVDKSDTLYTRLGFKKIWVVNVKLTNPIKDFKRNAKPVRTAQLYMESTAPYHVDSVLYD